MVTIAAGTKLGGGKSTRGTKMVVDQCEQTPSQARRRPVQFGLRMLFALTAFVAVSCSLMFTMPNTAATPALVVFTIALPAVLTAVAIYGGGYQRTFCIGALFPAGTMLVCTSLMLLIHSISAYQNTVTSWTEFAEEVGPYYRPYVGLTWVSSIAVGLLTVMVRWLVERSG